MSKISNILSEIGVSKVRLAKYLGVSRQMLYNYLALDRLEEWPSEKATRLMQLLEIKKESDLDNIEVDGEYIIKIDTKLNEGVKVVVDPANLAAGQTAINPTGYQTVLYVTIALYIVALLMSFFFVRKPTKDEKAE